MIDFYSLARFLNSHYKISDQYKATFDFSDELKKIEAYSFSLILDILKERANTPDTPEYINGMMFGIALCASSNDELFKELVDTFEQARLEDEVKDWKIEDLKDVKL